MGCRVQGRKREKRASLAQGSLGYAVARGSGTTSPASLQASGGAVPVGSGTLSASTGAAGGGYQQWYLSPIKYTPLYPAPALTLMGTGTLPANSHAADSDFQSRFLTPYSFAAAKYGSDTNTIPPIIFPRVTRRRL